MPGQLEEVVALVAGQPQRPGERAEHLLARLRTALLLKPRVVVGRHHGQRRDILAPQARGAAAGRRRNPDVGGLKRLAAAAQEVR
jgi:hypothetical protein